MTTTPAAHDPTSGALQELKRLVTITRQTLGAENNALAAFVAKEDARTIFSHVRREEDDHDESAETVEHAGGAQPDDKPDPDSVDVTNGATSTAFAFARLLPPDTTERPHTALGIGADQLGELTKTFTADIARMYATEDGDAQAKETGDLPNPYNTSLHLAGLAALGIHGQIGADGWKTGARIALDHLVGWFKPGSRIRRAEQTPCDPQDGLRPGEIALATVYGDTNRYLTYLAADALASWLFAWETRHAAQTADLSQDDTDRLPDDILDALRVAYAHAIADLSRQIAAQSIGRQSLFDAMDLVCTLATVCITGNATRLVDEYHRGIVAQAVHVAGARHVHDDGSFFPKGAAFTTADKHSVVLSSAEIGDILFKGVQARIREADGKWRSSNSAILEAADLIAFEPAVDAVIRRRSGQRGWGASAQVETARPIFTTATSLSLLRRFRDLSNQVVAAHAARELNVTRYAPSQKLDKIIIPSNVWDDIERYTIKPLLNERWDRADLSMVLWGPPGTAKSTIAQKIAQELTWPFLELDQGRFLTKGTPNLEAEAERIFGLLQDLERTVVLLDEVEGMMGDRGKGTEASSFLTTSMLPRMHHLRDRARVVFIVATNYKEKLDAAATRPGRIDRMIEVRPPDDGTRQSMISTLLNIYDVPASPGALQKTLETLDVQSATKDWAWGYLEGLVRRCANNIEQAPQEQHQELCAKALKIEKQRYTDEQALYNGTNVDKSTGATKAAGTAS